MIITKHITLTEAEKGRLLAQTSDDDLLAEGERRGLKVGNTFEEIRAAYEEMGDPLSDFLDWMREEGAPFDLIESVERFMENPVYYNATLNLQRLGVA